MGDIKLKLNTEQDILNYLSVYFKINRQVITEVAHHPLKFAKRVIENDDDNRHVRIRYFGIFTQKRFKNKSLRSKYKELYSDVDLVFNILKSLDYKPINERMALDMVKDMMRKSKVEEFNTLYSKFIESKKQNSY